MLSAPEPAHQLANALVPALPRSGGHRHDHVRAPRSARLVFLQDFIKVLLISYFDRRPRDDRRQFRLDARGHRAVARPRVRQARMGEPLSRAGREERQHRSAFLGDNNGVALGTMMLVPDSRRAGARRRRGDGRSMRSSSSRSASFMRGFTTYSRGGFLCGRRARVSSLSSARKRRCAHSSAWRQSLCLVWSVMPQEYWNRIGTITCDEEERWTNPSAGRVHFWRVATDMAQRQAADGRRAERLRAVVREATTRAAPFGEDARRTARGSASSVISDSLVCSCLLANLSWRCGHAGRSPPRRGTTRSGATWTSTPTRLITSLVVFAVGGSFLSQPVQRDVLAFRRAVHGPLHGGVQ